MVQVKKEAVHSSILAAARQLFEERGYQGTTMPAIAKHAGITTGNIYKYFTSKFELLFVVLTDWIEAKFSELEDRIAAGVPPEQVLPMVLDFLWVEMPQADNNFELNLMAALSTKGDTEAYSPGLLQSLVDRTARILEQGLSGSCATPQDCQQLAHMIFMCHDGFVLDVNLSNNKARRSQLAEFFTRLVSTSLTRDRA